MKTSLEHLEPTKVKLTVEVEAERVKRAFDEAAREIAKQVQIPGFRKGKVPRKLLEQRIGKEAIASQAVEGAVSSYYAEAVQDQELRVVAPPEVDLQTFSEEEGCAFEATVEVRPEIELPDHEGIDVTHPDWEIDHEQVETQIEELRERFAELDEVDRPAKRGDYVTIDLTVRKGGEVIEDATAEDAMYEVGSGGVTPKLDEELPGTVAGQSLTYVDELPEDYPEHGGENVEFTVVVKDVRAKELPPLDDDFAMTASEFDTIDELRADLRERMSRSKSMEQGVQARDKVLDELLERAEVPLPESVVQSEVDGRKQEALQQVGDDEDVLARVLEAEGKSLEDFESETRAEAEKSVRTQLLLDTIAEQEGTEVSEAELTERIMYQAQRFGISPDEYVQRAQQSGQLGAIYSDVRRGKALATVVRRTSVTNESGNPVDLEALFGSEESQAGDEAAKLADAVESEAADAAQPDEVEGAVADAGEATDSAQSTEDGERSEESGEASNDR